MGNSLFQAICRVGIFMICAQAVVHFRPKESYEKYLKLLVSVMVLIQVFLPIGSFLLGEGRLDAANAMEQFRQELERSMQEAAGQGRDADEILEKMTLEEIRRQMEEKDREDTSPEKEILEDPNEGEQEQREQRIEIESTPIEPVTIPPIESTQSTTREEKEP